jgi:F0F1-type ATP synthase epsilon subunit
MDSVQFHLKVASREGTVFDGDVESITSFNDKGKFDVLASHANFISLIKDNLTIRKVGEKVDNQIKFENALLRVRENFVEVYLGIEGMTSGFQAF